MRSEQSCQDDEGLPKSPQLQVYGDRDLITWRKREVRYFEHKHPDFF